MVNPDFILSPSRLGVILQRGKDTETKIDESTPGLPAAGSSGAPPTTEAPLEPESTTEQPPAPEEEGPETPPAPPEVPPES